jgi:hypothetical protein
MSPTQLIPTTHQTTTITQIEERVLNGYLADVMYTAGRYQEMGVAVRAPEQLTPVTPGQVTYRVFVTPGAPTIPIGIPDGSQVEAIDYVIAAGPIVKYALIAGSASLGMYGLYRIIHGIGTWFGVHGAAVAEGTVGLGIVLALVMLLAMFRSGKGCAGIPVHCGGCNG